MRRIFPSLLFIFIFSAAFAQVTPEQLQNMNVEQRREVIAALSPDQKMKLLHQFRTNVMVADLEVPSDKKEAFSKVLSDYQESQRRIKEKFRAGTAGKNLSDSEARERLDESFELGLELLNNKKQYAREFQKILTPKQVLQLFQSEGEMRDKVIERKNERIFRNNPSNQNKRNQGVKTSTSRNPNRSGNENFDPERGNTRMRSQNSAINNPTRGNSGLRSNPASERRRN